MHWPSNLLASPGVNRWGKMRFKTVISTSMALSLIVLVMLGAGQVQGQDCKAESGRSLRVITSGGFAAAYNILKPEFEASNGIVVHTSYGSSSGGASDSIPERLKRGETFDLLILSRPSLDRLIDARQLIVTSSTDLVKSTIGMAVKSGAAKPDIGSEQALITTLRNARSIAYSASASGTYLSTVLWPRMGLWDQIKAKSRRIESERVAAVVARGEVEIGFQQISEILPIEGAELVGPIPQALQKITIFAAAISNSAKEKAAANCLLKYLSSPQVAPVIRGTGLLPVTLKSGADNYPSQPLTVVVGFGVGGSADRMARAMSSPLSEVLGQPVRVVNKKGAGTLLAANYVLSRPHDGYTLFASTFSPYLLNTVLNGVANYTIDDFSYLNFQWFDEDLIALSKASPLSSLAELLQAIRDRPKTVKASVVKGSAGHLMAKLLLEINNIPQVNLNLVTYNSGGKARAAVAGGVVDFIVISAKGSESIREYLRPLAIVSDQASDNWQVPTLNQALAPLGLKTPVLPGSMRGFATSTEFRKNYPQRYAKLIAALQTTLDDPDLQARLQRADIGYRWIGPRAADQLMSKNYQTFSKYAYLLNWTH